MLSFLKKVSASIRDRLNDVPSSAPEAVASNLEQEISAEAPHEPIIKRQQPPPTKAVASGMKKPLPLKRQPIIQPRKNVSSSLPSHDLENFIPLLEHYRHSSRQLRFDFPSILSGFLKRDGITLKLNEKRTFEGRYEVRGCILDSNVAYDDLNREAALLCTCIKLLPQFFALPSMLERNIKALEAAKNTFSNLVLYHFLITGVFPLIRVTKKYPGDYEVEIRGHKVEGGNLHRGKVLGNWISSNLQDAYARASQEAMTRVKVNKDALISSRGELLCWLEPGQNTHKAVNS